MLLLMPMVQTLVFSKCSWTIGAIKPWSEKALKVHRFLRKVHRECHNASKHCDGEEAIGDPWMLHETILKVTESIEVTSFNVAISQMMTLKSLQKMDYSVNTKKLLQLLTFCPFG